MRVCKLFNIKLGAIGGAEVGEEFGQVFSLLAP